MELEETLSGFFWVLGKDHFPKFLEFFEQFSVGKSDVEVRKQCSLGVAVQFLEEPVDTENEEPVIDAEQEEPIDTEHEEPMIDAE